MKLLIATGLYPPEIGGPATYTKFLEKHLPQHGIAVNVVAFTTVRKYPKIIRHIVYIFKLLRAGSKADLIYALDTVSVGVPACIASKILRKKLYLRVPGDYAWEQGQQRFGITNSLDSYLTKRNRVPFGVRVLAYLQYRVAHHAYKIIVPSDYMKSVVHAWGIDLQKISRVYSAYYPVTVSGDIGALRERFGYQGFVIVTSGRLVPWKGMKKLIDAVCTLHAQDLHVMLEIIGDGLERENLEKHIHEKNAESFVHLRGIVSKEELSVRIKAADVFVLNTQYEGLSHQLLEVMDIGIPIITTPVGGNSELIIHGEHGLMVAYNNEEELTKAIDTLHHDETLRNRLVEAARQRVLLFREDIVVHEFIMLLS